MTWWWQVAVTVERGSDLSELVPEPVLKPAQEIVAAPVLPCSEGLPQSTSRARADTARYAESW